MATRRYCGVCGRTVRVRLDRVTGHEYGVNCGHLVTVTVWVEGVGRQGPAPLLVSMEAPLYRRRKKRGTKESG